MSCSIKMRCQGNLLLKPQTQCKIIPIKTTPTSLSQPRRLRTQILSLSSSSPSTKEAQELKPGGYNVEFKTLGGCKLGISRYPDFEYNADGGFGTGTGKHGSNEEILVSFDVDKLYIPPLTGGTTKFLGLPLPPLLRIDIVPEILQGTIDKDSGKVDLAFKAKFWFSVGTIYRAPPLFVTTILTSEESEGHQRKGRGQRMDKDGRCRLVGVATVDPIDDVFMNSFLSLPTECLAILNATISLR